WAWNQSNHSGNRVKTSILNELDQDAPIRLRRRGLRDRADRVRDPATPADQAAEVVRAHRDLEHEIPVLLDLLDLHRVRVLDERPGEELDELAHLAAG